MSYSLPLPRQLLKVACCVWHFLPSYFPKCQKGSPLPQGLAVPDSSDTPNCALAVVFPSLQS